MANVGELRMEMGRGLCDELDRIVKMKEDYPVPYYIQVQLHRDYQGPAAFNKDVAKKEVKTENKRVIGQRLVCFDCPLRRIPNWEKLSPNMKLHQCDHCPFAGKCALAIPQLGSIVLKVDNADGSVEPAYILPLDLPVTGEDGTEVADIITDSVKKTGVV